jgi:general secretion pathway protein N
MNRKAMIILGVLGFVVTLLAIFPLRVALAMAGDLPLTARAIQGSIWSGRLVDATLDGISIGSFDTRFQAAQLFQGRAAIGLTSIAGERTTAVVYAGLNGQGIEALEASLSTPGAFTPLPLDSLELRNVALRSQDGNCAEASGQVKVNLVPKLGPVSLGQTMLGSLRCDGTAIALQLSSQSGFEKLSLRFMPDGQYSSRLIIKPQQEADRVALLSANFRESQAGLSFELAGRL